MENQARNNGPVVDGQTDVALSGDDLSSPPPATSPTTTSLPPPGHARKRQVHQQKVEKRKWVHTTMALEEQMNKRTKKSTQCRPASSDDLDPDSDGECLYDSKARDIEVHAAAAAMEARDRAAKAAEANKEAAARKSARASRKEAAARKSARASRWRNSVTQALQRMTKEQTKEQQQRADREARGASPLQKDGDDEGFGCGDDDDNDATGGAGGEKMPKASPLRTPLDAEMDEISRREALGAFPLQKDDDDDTGTSQADCDSDAGAEAETTNGGLAAAGQAGSSKQKLTAAEKRAKKNANKKKKRTEENKGKRKGGYVPIARANSQFNSMSAVVGVKRSCLPDAVVMAMTEEGIEVSIAEAYAAMPFAHEDPTILQAEAFLQTFDMELQPQPDLNSNALQLFMRKDGNYLLETELEIDGEKEAHFAVYCSKRAWKKYSKRGVGVLIDNSDNDFVGIEEKDRIDKQVAIRAFEGKWVGIKSAHLITVYRLVHKPEP